MLAGLAVTATSRVAFVVALFSVTEPPAFSSSQRCPLLAVPHLVRTTERLPPLTLPSAMQRFWWRTCTCLPTITTFHVVPQAPRRTLVPDAVRQVPYALLNRTFRPCAGVLAGSGSSDPI